MRPEAPDSRRQLRPRARATSRALVPVPRRRPPAALPLLLRMALLPAVGLLVTLPGRQLPGHLAAHGGPQDLGVSGFFGGVPGTPNAPARAECSLWPRESPPSLLQASRDGMCRSVGLGTLPGPLGARVASG